MKEPATATLTLAGQIFAGCYELQRLLGRGGMGSVYAALDTVTGRELALKQLGATARAEVRELFELEYPTLASLRHPNIGAEPLTAELSGWARERLGERPARAQRRARPVGGCRRGRSGARGFVSG